MNKTNWIQEVDYFSELTEEQKTQVMFMYANFGDRGSSSVESAGIGGIAHMTQFMGTDNFNSLFMAEDFYNQPLDVPAAYSVFATEHSSTTSNCSKIYDDCEDFK